MIVPKSKGSLCRRKIRVSLRGMNMFASSQVNSGIVNCYSGIGVKNPQFPAQEYRSTMIPIALNLAARLAIQQFCDVIFGNLI
jgi:hypothetical protein